LRIADRRIVDWGLGVVIADWLMIADCRLVIDCGLIIDRPLEKIEHSILNPQSTDNPQSTFRKQPPLRIPNQQSTIRRSALRSLQSAIGFMLMRRVQQ
jgi:hypothetical protein